MLNKQADLLSKARFAYLDIEAERKTFESRLIRESSGKSHVDKLTEAQASDSWLDFHKRAARLEAIYEFEKLKFSVLEKEWLAQHQSLKLDGNMVRKGVE